LSGTAPNLTYTPAPNYYGPDSFTFKVNDGTASSAGATVAITVTPVNDAPVGLADNYTISEDTVLAVPAPGVLANDIDVDGDPLTSVLVNSAKKGTVTLNPNGSFTYTPGLNFNGTDSFTYRPRDGSVNGNPTTVTIVVTPVNDAPIANAGADQAAVLKQGKAAVTLDGSGSADPDGDTLTYRWMLGSTELGTTRKLTTSFTAVGVYTIALTVKDPAGATSTDQAIITVR
jgi:VCBS repeat-containing protein